MNYKVTYPIDTLDTKPVIKTFETEYEAEELTHLSKHHLGAELPQGRRA